MAVRVKVDPIERVTTASILSTLSLPEQKKAAADFVRGNIAEADNINKLVLGRVPPRTITVDGRQGAALESVNPNGGNVVVEYELVSDVLVWIGNALRERSPVVSGAYRAGHTLLADGIEVAADRDVPVADEYIFLNTVPYARKIEVGKTRAGRAFVIQVPNRIYERTAKDARSRFGNVASIKFGYRQTTSAYQLRRPRRSGGSVSSPSIIVTLKNA